MPRFCHYNYDRRKEMQGRGTEHFHSAVHVKDAPKLDVDSDDTCASFADIHISCHIPAIEDEKMRRTPPSCNISTMSSPHKYM